MDPIPFLDLKRQYHQIKTEIHSAIENVLNEAAFSGGYFVQKFEEEFAGYCETAFAITVNSGTSALHLALLACNIGRGDEVIVPANTFIATASAVSLTGATPVFVDCDERTWNIDPKKAEQAISSKTKAIIGVHLYGQPCEVDELLKICRSHNLFFIEDCAQAHGAKYQEKKIGGFGDAGCFSFYPGKNLGAYGEGGAVTTNNKEIAEKVQLLKDLGSIKKYYHDIPGHNMRIDGMQASILSVKLKYLDEWNTRRKAIAAMYDVEIPWGKFKKQLRSEHLNCVFHLYVITADEREKLIQYLNDKKIYPGMHYPLPCHLQKAYENLSHKKGDFPNAEYLSQHCLSLPMFPELTDEEVLFVIDALNKF